MRAPTILPLLITFLSATAAGAAAKTSKTYQSCGGLRPGAGCPEGYSCIDDPRVKGCGMACDRPGICVSANLHGDVACAGFAGLACKDTKRQCYDVPNDGCDPNNKGRDCSGICLYPL